MRNRYVQSLIDAYLTGGISRNQLMELGRMLRYCPEVRFVASLRGRAAGDWSLVRRAAAMMPAFAGQR